VPISCVAFDEVIQLSGRDIDLIGVDRRSDGSFLDKLYLLPDYQNRGIGSYLLQRLIDDARSAQVDCDLRSWKLTPPVAFISVTVLS
jgi:GNAT superfamily N-acetyltransferase